MIVLTKYFNQLLSSILAEHVGAGGFSGPLYNLSLLLYQTPIPLDPNVIFSMFTEANYSGYARPTGIAWGTPILQADGTYTQLSQLLTFTGAAMSNFTGNVIFGWALIDTASTPNVIMCEQLATPQAIQTPGAGFGLVIEVNMLPVNPNSFGNVIA